MVKRKRYAVQLNRPCFPHTVCNLQASFKSRYSEFYQIQLTTPSRPRRDLCIAVRAELVVYDSCHYFRYIRLEIMTSPVYLISYQLLTVASDVTDLRSVSF